MKQREHEKRGGIDYYPEIDCYIPEAERIAHLKNPDGSKSRYKHKWNKDFLNAMDAILKKRGLRV